MTTVERTELIDLTLEPPVLHAPAARTLDRRRLAGLALLLLGVVTVGFLLFEFALSGMVEARAQHMLLGRFKALTDQGPATVVGWRPSPGDPVALLSIPAIGLQPTVVVEGTSASETAQGPAHYRASPLPGFSGNAVIAGRRTTFGAPFAHLDRLQPGDTIVTTTGLGMFTYTVKQVHVIEPGAVDAMGPSTENRLTLVTSSPPYRASGRLVVTASLNGGAITSRVAPLTIVPANETGLTGEPAAAGLLLVALEALLLSVVVGVGLARRASPRVAWLLGTPVVLALLLVVFEQLSRLLPATL